MLVQLRDAIDPETGERYTVKRYESEKAGDPIFQSIELTGADEDQVKVIAECVEVLAGES